MGHETTALTTSYILYELARNPDIQSKLREEVRGMEKHVSAESINKLVYLDAVVKEAMRWMPPTPVGLTHYTKEDDVVNGYFIPAGTVVLSFRGGHRKSALLIEGV